MADRYPGWRYHHTEDAIVVQSEEEDERLAPADEGWRDAPYSDEECDALADAGDEKPEDAAKPQRHEFATAAKYKAALKAWQAKQ